MVYSILIMMMIPLVLLMLSMLISVKNFTEEAKYAPIECGMIPLSPPFSPFSLQFFLIAILFMIFDVEIALLLPLPFSLMTNMFSFFIIATLFLIILLLGILYEWYNGALNWMK
uniref:NADH-ubiquinone oxidoreductase chain 3 n=1 Tax=Anoplodactylus australis TaxID=2992006 RepID=A0A9E7V7G2_9CHEL|nr:NADH dehydrogenase subunit 3 [Anoplodactylus australis]UZA61241.1 NADH dehydrogenase subunit 3 [Anoplodactylus australis]